MYSMTPPLRNQEVIYPCVDFMGGRVECVISLSLLSVAIAKYLLVELYVGIVLSVCGSQEGQRKSQ